ILYGFTSFAFFLVGGFEALLIRAQLATPNGKVLNANVYDQVFTMHGLTMIFLVVMPLSAAFFNYMLPLMIGARDVAFPRLNAFSYWVFLFGGLFIYSGFLLGGAPNGGWFGYAPLSTKLVGHGMDFYQAGAGGGPVLWQHLFWLFGHPEVYVLILPAMGIVSEVLPVFSRKPLFGYPVVVFSGIAIGFMGWGVWAHHMFAVGLGPVANSAFALSTMFIAVPTGVKIFNWMGTLHGGDIRFRTPLLFALGFIAMFTIGGLSGVTHAVVPADYQQTDTYYVVAHFHYVLFGGSIFGLFAGIYYWWPKITGKLLSEAIGKVHFWLMLIGFNVTFGPFHILGLQGM